MTKGYLLFDGETKVGMLPNASIENITNIPTECVVTRVDKKANILSVELLLQ